MTTRKRQYALPDKDNKLSNERRYSGMMISSPQTRSGTITLYCNAIKQANFSNTLNVHIPIHHTRSYLLNTIRMFKVDVYSVFECMKKKIKCA